MSEHKIPIPSMLYNAAVGGHVTNSQQIIDENLNREQNDINQETVGAVPYNSTTPNGMGRIVLKKNDNFKKIVEAQTNGNTIFIIKYDFTLTGNVTIPANCVLEFEGGSISGAHTITFNNTLIKANAVKIFDISLSLAGSLADNRGHIKWFGASQDKDDNTAEVQKLVDSFDIVLVDGYSYKIKGINLTKAHTIMGLEDRFISGCGFTFTDDITDNSTLITCIFNNSNPYILFKDITLYGHIYNSSYQPNTVGIDITAGVPVRIYNCVFENLEIALKSNYNSYYNYIEKCRIINIKWAFYKFHANNLNIIANRFDSFENVIYQTIGNGPMNIRNNSFESFTNSIFLSGNKAEFNLNLEENYIESHRCETILKGCTGNIYSKGNLIQILGTEENIGSIDCIYYITDCKNLISINNTINLRGIKINQYVKTYFSTSTYRTVELAILKDSYDDGGNVDLTSYISFGLGGVNKTRALLEGYDFITKRAYSTIMEYTLFPTSGGGYTLSEIDKKYLKYWVKDNVIYFSGILKKDSTTITEGKTNIASISLSLTDMQLTHNVISSYPETDKIYIKAMDTSYNQIILLLHISTGIIDFIKGDTTKDIIFDGCCAPIPS